jgi:hypothetical protein
LKFKPTEEFRNQMTEICSALQDRSRSVESGLRAGIQNKLHPAKLPLNIYGTTGEWEEYSTPSRDARLKVAFYELRKNTEKYITLFDQKSSRIAFTPKPNPLSGACATTDARCFLVSELQTVFADLAQKPECAIAYNKSNGAVQKLTYFEIQDRLFKLSFDPYHCAERRWGATEASELGSCSEDSSKKQWYVAEQGLRNQLERAYDMKMDLDVQQTAQSLGVKQSPDVDVWSYLERQKK